MTYEKLSQQDEEPGEALPQDIRDIAADLDEAPSRDVALRKAYDVLVDKYETGRLTWLFFPWRMYTKDLYTVWNKYDKVPCTTLNRVLTAILTETKWFSEEDIEFRWTLVWLCPHEYVRVTCDDHTVDVDVWGARFGVPYAEHARWLT